MLLAPDALLDAALAGSPAGQWWVRFADGRRRQVPVRRWLGPTGERRSLALLAPDGRVLVETLRAPLDVPGLVQLEGPAGRSHPSPCSFVAAEGLEALAARTGLAVTGSWDCAGRAFAQLEPRAPGRRP